MAGSIPLSMTQQLDIYGEPLSGGYLHIYQAGTVATPQNPYQDLALTVPLPNPIILDAAGRIPQFFLADGYVKIALTDVHGVTQLTGDNILVIGPSSGGGGGGGGTIDPTTILSTGDMKFRYDTAILSGYVRANGLTIGSAVSSATELADPTAQALFNFLWNRDASLPVYPSRGASSAVDWTANKQLQLPDFRGYALSALDDMGNAAAGRLTTAGFGTTATVLGASGGLESRTMSAAQMPVHYHVCGIYDPSHTHTSNAAINVLGSGTPGPFTQLLNLPGAATINAATTGLRINSSNGLDTTYNAGAGAAMPAIGPRKLITFYLKL